MSFLRKCGRRGLDRLGEPLVVAKGDAAHFVGVGGLVPDLGARRRSGHHAIGQQAEEALHHRGKMRGIRVQRLEVIPPSMEDVFVAMIEQEERKIP